MNISYLGFMLFSPKVISGESLGVFLHPSLYIIALGQDAESWMCVIF